MDFHSEFKTYLIPSKEEETKIKNTLLFSMATGTYYIYKIYVAFPNYVKYVPLHFQYLLLYHFTKPLFVFNIKLRIYGSIEPFKRMYAKGPIYKRQ